jgi:hypothetical protein
MNHKPVPGSDVLLAKVFDHDETSESTTAILLTATAQMITDCRTLVVLAHKHPEHACSLDAANLVSLPQPSSRTRASHPRYRLCAGALRVRAEGRGGDDATRHRGRPAAPRRAAACAGASGPRAAGLHSPPTLKPVVYLPIPLTYTQHTPMNIARIAGLEQLWSAVLPPRRAQGQEGGGTRRWL